ncbi:hypothetical protein D3C75_591620 [compost metagenome]
MIISGEAYITTRIVKSDVVDGDHTWITIACKTISAITKGDGIADGMCDMNAFATKLEAIFITGTYGSVC